MTLLDPHQPHLLVYHSVSAMLPQNLQSRSRLVRLLAPLHLQHQQLLTLFSTHVRALQSD
jgi:hypothetical protein